jgi:hypothetical protein
MRILVAANASYMPPRGGATRSNLAWLEELVAAGHACRVVCAGLEESEGRRQMAEEEIPSARTHAGIAVYAVAARAKLAAALAAQAREFQPDWLLVSSEDLGHALLRAAHALAPGRVVYLAHTPQFFPFGPENWSPDAQAAELVRQAAGVVAIGHHMAGYIREHLGREAAVVHPPVYGRGPFPELASFERGAVTMINPCAVKGTAIFEALAARFPRVPFAAVPGWGTTSGDLARLRCLANVELLPNFPRIERLFERTRVFLMPSLWYEGFGLVAMEAMLHGIPVIASDSGGLVEAKTGTGFVVPAPRVERYEPVYDERAMPRPVTGAIDLEPWAAALHTLLSDREAYARESAASRRAAAAFVGALPPRAMEAYLAGLAPSAPAAVTPSIEHLSPERRALLLARLRKKGRG